MVEHDMWEKKEDLENAKELVDKFEERLGAEVRRVKRVDQKQKVKMNPKAEKFRRSELLGRYTAKLLYGWDNKKFGEEYLKKLDRNWNRQKNNRKKEEREYEKKYIRELEKSLEWNKIDEKTSRTIWGDSSVPLEVEL